MAASVYNNIRLDADLDGSNLPINEYKAIQGGMRHLPQAALAVERSLTGKLHVHRIRESGDPMVIEGYRYELLLTSRDELSQLQADLGKDLYLMRHARDESVPASYTEVVLFKGMPEVENIDPYLNWWRVVIELEESTGNTP
jgi:hypothetical protein